MEPSADWMVPVTESRVLWRVLVGLEVVLEVFGFVPAIVMFVWSVFRWLVVVV